LQLGLIFRFSLKVKLRQALKCDAFLALRKLLARSQKSSQELQAAISRSAEHIIESPTPRDDVPLKPPYTFTGPSRKGLVRPDRVEELHTEFAKATQGRQITVRPDGLAVWINAMSMMQSN
jgi:hypothetical protein